MGIAQDKSSLVIYCSALFLSMGANVQVDG